MIRNKFLTVSLAFSFLLFSQTVLAGGGWTLPKGEGFFKLGQTAIRSGSFFDGAGGKQDIFTTSVYITSLYGEYGFNDRLTGIAYAPLLTRLTVNNVEFASGGFQEGEQWNWKKSLHEAIPVLAAGLSGRY